MGSILDAYIFFYTEDVLLLIITLNELPYAFRLDTHIICTVLQSVEVQFKSLH